VISGVRSLAAVLCADADLLEAVAWLHDIGYTADLATTGLHALDGARYLRDAQHADAMLCRLVAYRSCAIIEAANADSPTSFLEFEPTPPALSSVLPDGEPEPVEKRLAGKHHGYGPGHPVAVGRNPGGARSSWSG